MILLEVASSTDGAAPWSNVFFGFAIGVTAVYFGWQLYKVGRNYRARMAAAQISVAEAEDKQE